MENRATDDQLRDACLGRDVPRLVMMDMVRRAEQQYRQAEQAGYRWRGHRLRPTPGSTATCPPVWSPAR